MKKYILGLGSVVPFLNLAISCASNNVNSNYFKEIKVLNYDSINDVVSKYSDYKKDDYYKNFLELEKITFKNNDDQNTIEKVINSNEEKLKKYDLAIIDSKEKLNKYFPIKFRKNIKNERYLNSIDENFFSNKILILIRNIHIYSSVLPRKYNRPEIRSVNLNKNNNYIEVTMSKPLLDTSFPNATALFNKYEGYLVEITTNKSDVDYSNYKIKILESK
ncbi:hypothetical protein AAW50_03700 [Mycoplasmopsis canis]|uniref:hypothetical protein n=1 Tax=Mycoplasmopsis canis TaxID=29555 RepID=UPI0006249796|nr:hypothetical protein [Mycoplasmopsis canis]AKF41491.1 hypothetical protein AAW50_03700 [Mycoplasmopsis canis]